MIFSAAASAQPFGAGLKLGTSLTDAVSAVQGYPASSSRPLIVGPYVEVRLPLGFAVEADALYESSALPSAISGGSSWNFPVLAKYRFAKGPVRPYVEGGPSFSHLSDIAEIPALNHRSNFGITLGAGIEVKLLFLRVAPELRYTGWALTSIESPGQFQSNRNQATFTVGIGF